MGFILNLVVGPQSERNLGLIQDHFKQPILKLDMADYDNLEQALPA